MRRRTLTGEHKGEPFDYDVYMPDVHAWLLKNALSYAAIGKLGPIMGLLVSRQVIAKVTPIYLKSVDYWEKRVYFDNLDELYPVFSTAEIAENFYGELEPE